jgi:hypothetical protein
VRRLGLDSMEITRLMGLAAGLAMAGMTTLAMAAPRASPRAGALQQLADCRPIADSAARLACYDKAAAGLDAAEAKGDIVVVDRDQANKVRRQAFGFTLPSLSILDRGDKREDVDQLVLKIEAASRGGDGKWVFRLEGGQVWRQIDTDELMREPKVGALATIKRAALGSYRLSLGGASAIRVHRAN